MRMRMHVGVRALYFGLDYFKSFLTLDYCEYFLFLVFLAGIYRDYTQMIEK